MTTVLFPFFVGLWENHFGLANFFYQFTPQAKFGWTGERKKYSDLTFSQNFEKKKIIPALRQSN